MASCTLEQRGVLNMPAVLEATSHLPRSTCSRKYTSRCNKDSFSSSLLCHKGPSKLSRPSYLVSHANYPPPTLCHLSDEIPSETRAACISDNSHAHGVKNIAIVPMLAVAFGVCAVFLGEPALAQTHQKAGVDMDMTALALGPEGPLVEEFWENVTRYIAYFFTVASGGAYAIVKPITELLRKPITAVLVIIALGGGAVITYLTLSSMLGLGDSPDPYSF